jgi:hypothetical protein
LFLPKNAGIVRWFLRRVEGLASLATLHEARVEPAPGSLAVVTEFVNGESLP